MSWMCSFFGHKYDFMPLHSPAGETIGVVKLCNRCGQTQTADFRPKTDVIAEPKKPRKPRTPRQPMIDAPVKTRKPRTTKETTNE